MRQFLGVTLAVLLFLGPIPALAFSTADEEKALQLRAVANYLAQLQGQTDTRPLSTSMMRQIVNDGTSWLLNAQETSGHFAYEYAPYEGEYLRGDNIVRQGGALFALSEVYRRQDQKKAELEAGIKEALKYFEEISKEGKENGTNFRCVAKHKRSSICQLGATSLVLAGLLGYVAGEPTARVQYQDLIDDYLAFILMAQTEAGGFSNEYRVDLGFSEAESPYGNGEALLALARAYQLKPQTKIKAAFDQAFDYLKLKEYENPLYLWIMAALKDMNQLWPNDDYISYAEDFTNWRLNLTPEINTGKNYCAYSEGLASSYSILESSASAVDLTRLKTVIDKFNRHHFTLQLGVNNQYRVVPQGEALTIKALVEPEQAYGGFLTSGHIVTQRIDFTQHCVSTYLQTLVDIDGETI